MTTPFTNSLVGAQGALVRSQIKSPNFSIPGHTGWAILANGQAYFFNVTASGTITATAFVGTDFLINAAGEFFYSAAPATGDLIASIAPANGADGFGNPNLAGIVSYQGNIAVQLSANALNFVSSVSGDVLAGSFLWDPIDSLVRWEGTHTFIWSMLSSSQLVIATSVIGAASTSALLEVQGTMGLANASAPATVAGYAQPFASGGNLAVKSADGNVYDTQVLHLTVLPAQTIAATAFPNPVTGASVPLGIGRYRFRCKIIATTSAAAGAPQLEFTFPTATGEMDQTYTPLGAPGNAQSNQNTFSANTVLSLAIGPTLNGHGFMCVWEGDLTTTAAGNLALGAITNTMGDTYVVAQVWFWLWPVN